MRHKSKTFFSFCARPQTKVAATYAQLKTENNELEARFADSQQQLASLGQSVLLQAEAATQCCAARAAKEGEVAELEGRFAAKELECDEFAAGYKELKDKYQVLHNRHQQREAGRCRLNSIETVLKGTGSGT